MVIFIIIILGILIFNSLPEQLTWRLKHGMNIGSDASFQARLRNWKEHIDHFIRSPIFGLGPAKTIEYNSQVDNEWLLLLRQYGIIGTLYFLIVFVTPFIRHKDKFYKYLYYSVLVASALYMIPAIVYNSFQIMPLIMILAALLSSTSKVKKEKNDIDHDVLERGRWERRRKMIKTFNKRDNKFLIKPFAVIIMAMIIATTSLANPIFAREGLQFPDISAGHWSRAYVENLAGKGIIKGYENGNFGPNDSLRRGQTSKMIAIAAGLDFKGKVAEFPDVNKNGEMSPYIAALVEQGAIRGFPDGNFKMHENISRRQIAQIVVKGFGLKKANIKVDFSDTNFASDPEAKENIQILASNGIVKGYQEGNKTLYRPGGETTRAQFAKILSVAMAVSSLQEAEEVKTPQAISKAEKIINSLPEDTSDETTKANLQIRLDELQGSLFVELTKALPTIEEINKMDGPGLNKISNMIDSANGIYESLSTKTKAHKEVLDAKENIKIKENTVAQAEASSISTFVNQVNSLPSLGSIEGMNLSQLDLANTEIGQARARHSVLSNIAKKISMQYLLKKP